jgi:hypothetical protein
MNVGDCMELFLFASKAGALEGYLYERAKTEPLTNWIDNIDNMYRGLPDSVKNEINEVYVLVLRKILQYGENVLDDLLKKKLKLMLSLAAGT